MGVGKTTIGGLVAGRLQRPLRDSDHDLRTTHRNARQLAARQGVDELHRLEADLLLDALASATPSVIAAAGSVVDDPRAVDALRAPDGPYVVWLWAPSHLLAPRLASGDHRRDLGTDPVAALARLAHDRDGRYRSVADATLDVSGRRPDEVAQAIVDLVTPAGFGPASRG
jgi:shikimate kinase